MLRGNNMKNTIAKVSIEDCTGCSACLNGCPQNAISLIPDKEGFLSPIIDFNKCINCGICFKICPALHYKLKNNVEPDCYAVWADSEIRKKSSSGGMFSLLANYVFENGGVVCGAAFTEDYKDVRHIVISDKSELYKLRLSKYVQSNIGHVYIEILNYLKQDKFVLFSGCPCQVAGLYSFLQHDYPKLITCDLICHGANSPMAYHAFLHDREVENGSSISKVCFREKWSTTTTINFTNKTIYRKTANSCLWYKGFLNGIINRKVCGHCKYATIPRTGDITLGDFWHINLYDRSLDDGKGTSCVLVNNEKGKEIFRVLKEKMELCKPVPLSHAQKHNWMLKEPQKANLFRNYFFDQLAICGYDKAIRRVLSQKFDVGLVSWWYNDNYGGVLTSYALFMAIKSFNLSVLMIDIPTITVDRKQQSLQTMSRKFARKHYYTSAFLPSMKEHNFHCDTFISGSDQMWNYNQRQKKTNRVDYHLGFVYDYKKKISYASSFGATAHAPEEYNMKISNLLHKFDYISVREDYAVQLCEDTFGLTPTNVLDPVFIANPIIYDDLANDSNALCEKKYLCAYILDPTDEKKEAIKFVSKKLELEIVVIGDPEPLHKNNKNKLKDLPGFQNNVELEDFVYYFKNSDFIITDSYHGTCFSMIFRKQFISIGNKERGIERFYSLFRKFPLSNRMVVNVNDIFEKEELFQSIDYTEFDKILSTERDRCLKWLKKAIFSPKKYQPLDFCVLENELEELNKKVEALKTMHNKEKDELSNRISVLENKSFLLSRIFKGEKSNILNKIKKHLNLGQ